MAFRALWPPAMVPGPALYRTVTGLGPYAPSVLFTAPMLAEITARLLLDRLALQERELAEVKRRLAVVEGKCVPNYLGVWEPREYERGSMVTHSGALWICLHETTMRPGDGAEN